MAHINGGITHVDVFISIAVVGDQSTSALRVPAISTETQSTAAV